MSAPARRRIDVSDDAHAWLEKEARRRGLVVRELVEEIVQKQVAGEGFKKGANGHAKTAPEGAATGSLMSRLEELIERFDTVRENFSVTLPKSISEGFAAIRETITKTGGTGHLRDMLTEHHRDHMARLNQIESTNKMAWETMRTTLTSLHANYRDDLGNMVGDVRHELRLLRSERKSHRKLITQGAAMGAGGLLLLELTLVFLLIDTPLRRSFARASTGNAQAVDAAFTPAADGSAMGALMAETKAMLSDRNFRESYTRCVSRARKATKRSTCEIRMPPAGPAAT